jgi:hypothetical protein
MGSRSVRSSRRYQVTSVCISLEVVQSQVIMRSGITPALEK